MTVSAGAFWHGCGTVRTVSCSSCGQNAASRPGRLNASYRRDADHRGTVHSNAYVDACAGEPQHAWVAVPCCCTGRLAQAPRSLPVKQTCPRGGHGKRCSAASGVDWRGRWCYRFVSGGHRNGAAALATPAVHAVGCKARRGICRLWQCREKRLLQMREHWQFPWPRMGA